MKKLSLGSKIGILVFFLVAIIVFFIARPFYITLSKNVDSVTDKMKNKVTEITGLNISYDEFSPSIMSFFNIKGIKLSDSEDRIVLNIKNTKINYRLKELLKGNYNSFVRSVSVNGVDVDIDLMIELVQRLSQIYKQKKIAEIDQILEYVPSNVEVQNVSLNFNNDDLTAAFVVKEISVLNSNWKNNIDFQLDCNGSVFVNQNQTKYTGAVYLNGSVLNQLDNSSVYICISDLTDGTYHLNKVNLYAAYKNNSFEIHTIQSVNPLSVAAEYNLAENKAKLSVKTDKLNPLSIVSASGKNEILKALKEIRLSVEVNADVDLNKIENGKIKSGAVSYNSKGNFNIPQNYFPGGAQIKYALNGNEKKINLTDFAIDGQKCTADGELSFNFNQWQLSGIANLSRFVLPNGCELSTQIYFDPLAKGFMLFSPQVFIGSKAITAVQAKVLPQNDSFDFDFELSDYSHFTSSEPGVISLRGSYLLASKFLQTGISFNSFYVDTILDIMLELLDSQKKEPFEKVKNTVKPYMFTGDLYVSTNFSSISYNLPYLVLANTEKENQLLFISVNGNEQNVQLDRFDLIFGKFAMNAAAGFDFIPDSKNVNFYLDANTSSIPYHFQGAIDSDGVKIAGDYGTDVEVLFGKDKSIHGHAFFDNLPFVYEKLSIILSTSANFNYTQQDGPEIQVERFEIEETDASSIYNPKLVFSGNGTKYGAQLNSISYTDLYSTLQGTADITVNINDGIFDSVGVNASLKDPTLSGEGINLDAVVSNPDSLILTKENINNALYVSALAEINNFSLNRFMAVKNSNNEVTATLSLSGTLEHPYVLVNVEKTSFLLANELVNANGSITLEDQNITINDFSVNQSTWVVHDITGNASIKSLTGEINAIFETKGTKNFVVPLKLDIQDSFIPDGSRLPESMIVLLSSDGIGGSLMKKKIPFGITAMYSPDFISFYSTDNMGLAGTYSFTDGLYAQMNSADVLSVKATGNFNGNNVALKLNGLQADLNKIMEYFAVDAFLKLQKGILSGDLCMNGTFDTPEFEGSLNIDNPSFLLPSIFENAVSADKITLRADHNEFILDENNYYIGKNSVFTLGSNIYLNKWVLDQMEIRLFTLNKKSLPLKFVSPIIDVSGEIDCNIKISMIDDIWDLSGFIFGEKINISSSLQNITNFNTENSGNTRKEVYFRSDLNVVLGNHVMLNFDPLLRCIFVPNTVVKLNMDSVAQSYKIEGQLNLKSGDIAYLNRSFYIKEGSIKFNPSEITNPQITIRAETREKDDAGQNTRIILSAENQYLLNFQPKFSSVPAKSEQEIYALLGQVVIADANSNGIGSLLSSAGDYYLQSVATRRIENKLRESLNFDIFSVRTNILQNTINVAKNTNGTVSKIPTIGNFLDNTTVYIGKYLGSALYIDAMLNLSVNNEITDITKANEFILQPEIGLEFEVPFANRNWRFIEDMDANFRLGLAMDAAFENIKEKPDIMFIPSFTMSLLWRF